MSDRKQPKLALSLRGGGARSAVYVGALQALEENGIHPDLMVGSSGGAYVAGVYAAGNSIQEIIEHMDAQGFETYFSMDSISDVAILSDEMLIKSIREIIGDLLIEDAGIPVHFQVTNLRAAKPEILSQGDMAHHMVASMAMPAFAKPVTINGVEYVDGDISHGYAAEFMRAQGADIVLGLCVNDVETVGEGKLDTPIQRALDAVTIANRRIRELDQELYPVDLLINDFDTLGYGLLDFKHSVELAEVGYNRMQKEIPKLLNLLNG